MSCYGNEISYNIKTNFDTFSFSVACGSQELGILFFVVLNANKLYALGAADICGIFSYFAFGIDMAYLFMDVILALTTFIFMVIAAFNFQRMEKG